MPLPQPKNRYNFETHEVHPDRRDVAFRVRVIGEPQEQTRLSHARVSDQKKLKQVVTGQSSIRLSGEKMKATRPDSKRKGFRLLSVFHKLGRVVGIKRAGRNESPIQDSRCNTTTRPIRKASKEQP